MFLNIIFFFGGGGGGGYNVSLFIIIFDYTVKICLNDLTQGRRSQRSPLLLVLFICIKSLAVVCRL